MNKLAKGRAESVDVEVGRRIRLRRVLLGKTQSDVADAIGVTFQQIQKYENGINRVSASALEKIAKFLDATVSHFFEPLSNHHGDPIETELMLIEGAPALLRAFSAIPDKVVRQRLVALAQSLAP